MKSWNKRISKRKKDHFFQKWFKKKIDLLQSAHPKGKDCDRDCSGGRLSNYLGISKKEKQVKWIETKVSIGKIIKI